MKSAVLPALGAVACMAATFADAGQASASSRQEGMASFYKHGRYTANGERFNPNGLTAAHRTLPFGTKVKVTHKKTGRSVIVRINDRGPFAKRRIIDVSQGAAKKLGMVKSGVASVAIEVVK